MSSCRREELLVALAPAEPREIVAQRDRQIAHGAIGVDAERPVALRELRAVGAVDQRNMRESRGLPAHRLVDVRLPRGVGEMIVAADDLRDAHVVVVDDDGEHIGRRAVGAQQHEIVEVLVGEGDAPLHRVVDDRLALARRLEPNDRACAGRSLGRIAVAPAPVVTRRPAFRLGLLAHLLELCGRGEAAIGLALGEQLFRHLAMTRRAGELIDRVAVPIEPEPAHAVEDRVDGRGGRALAIRVLDAQQHFTAVLARVEPVEQRGARGADVEKTCGGGRKTRDDFCRHPIDEVRGWKESRHGRACVGHPRGDVEVFYEISRELAMR